MHGPCYSFPSKNSRENSKQNELRKMKSTEKPEFSETEFLQSL